MYKYTLKEYSKFLVEGEDYSRLLSSALQAVAKNATFKMLPAF